MRVLQIGELVDFLENEFKNIEFDLDDLILKKNEIGDEEVNRIIEILRLDSLPLDFLTLITKYDFSNYTILATTFGSKREKSLNWILDRNRDYSGFYGDYFKSLHQDNLIVVASGDPYTILLDIISGDIYAITDETNLVDKLKVANSFIDFLRLLGTAFYAVRKEKIDDLLFLLEKEFEEDTIEYCKTILGYYN